MQFIQKLPESFRDTFKLSNFPQGDLAEISRLIQLGPEDKTLIDFLRKFEPISHLFVNTQVIARLTEQVIEHAHSKNVRHLELRFSPFYMDDAHRLSHDQIVQAVIDGRDRAYKSTGLWSPLILIVERQLGLEPAAEILRLAKKYQSQGVVAIDLANDEYHFPPGPYAAIFQEAKAAGLYTTVHAGEGGNLDNVSVALKDLKADRIGHGVSAALSPEAMSLLAKQRTPVEICLTSNIQTGAAKSFRDHPLRHFIEAGLSVSINTDDPAISAIDWDAEWLTACREFGLTFADIRRITEDSINAAFLDKASANSLRTRILLELEELARSFSLG